MMCNISFLLHWLKGELKRENKLILYERAFKMLENDMYIAGIGRAILKLVSFEDESVNHKKGISLLQKFSGIFGNDVTSDKSQFPNIKNWDFF